MRAPNSPLSQPSRKTSIAEMLSSPPPLENTDFNINSNSSLSNLELNNPNSVPHSPAVSSISSILNQDDLVNNDGTDNEEYASSMMISRNPSTSSTASHFLNGASLEWQDIKLSELVEQNKLIRISDNISVEQAFQTLVENGLTSVPVESTPNDLDCLTFDYTDLNTYLLLVLNKLKIENLNSIDYEPKSQILDYIKAAQTGKQVPVSFVIRLSHKNPFLKLNESDTSSTVVEILGTGVHRIAIINNNKLTGILSQRRLVKFLWDNARRFPSMEGLLSSSIRSLHIGSSNPVSIFGDEPLIEALMKMHNLKMSSLAVVDRNYHLLGNISVTDVRLVSSSSKSDLLYKSSLHFISVILNSRGLENGKDSFPIFHVTAQTSLGRAIAKLVATKAHRLWIVKPESASSTPSSQDSNSKHSHNHSHSHSHSHNHKLEDDVHATGKLVGVLSLTDILSLYAKTLGKAHVEPSLARRQRRRSSSGVSALSNGSLEMFRKSISESSQR